MNIPNQRVAWFNGKIVPESEVVLPFRDRGVKYGDAVFDTTRTFGHHIFRLEDHLDRLYRSLRYVRIDPGMSLEEMADLTREVLAQNMPLIGEDEDYWITQRVTRGITDPNERDAWPDHIGPTVIIECLPLPLAVRARLYRHGIDAVTPSVRRVAPDMLSPRAKTHNYLNLIMADLENQAPETGAFSVLLDHNGNLCEGRGSNVFIVADGKLLTPRERYVLAGVSRRTVIELAGELGIECEEADIDMFEAYGAQEAFITSTSLCICPIRGLNGQLYGDGSVPGPVTRRLMNAYIKLVDFDWEAQYLRYPNVEPGGPAGAR